MSDIHYELRLPDNKLASAFCYANFAAAWGHKQVLKLREAQVVEVVVERRERALFDILKAKRPA